MSLKRRLIIFFSIIMLILGVALTGLVWFETEEQLEILGNPILSDAEKIKEIEHEIREILLAITLFIFIIMFMALLVITFVTNQFLKPFVLLSEQLEQRSSLNLSFIQAPEGSKEIKIIVVRINQLLENIADRIEYEKQFTADVAHELRTPLAGLRLNLELMDDFPDRVLFINRIDDLLRTIERLLQFARANHELHSNELIAFNFYESIILPLQTEYSESFPHPIKWEIPKDLVIYGDQSLIFLMMKNLLDNVAFYAGESEETIVSAQCSEGGVFLSVKDRGLGINPKRLEEMTKRFQRIDESRVGFGLGLSIVERIVRAHHGKLIINNRADGSTGLVVKIILPY